jgi:S1-C subfamily serine protease
MRVAMTTIVISAAMVAAGAATAYAAEIFAGSGILIGASGEILTNAHVVEACRSIKLTFANGSAESGTLVAHDEQNDLALLRTRRSANAAAVAVFREGPPLRPGESIVVLGYPLTGVLATGANLSVGNVSALAGLGDDSRFIQISAPVQPGNSGGPLVDTSGHLVGIVTAKLDALHVARAIGDIPQNVNFALKAQVARTFLDSKFLSYKTEKSTARLSAADVGEIARPFTVHITCTRTERREAAATPASAPGPATDSPRAAATGAPAGGLKGPLREVFVKKSHRSCTRKIHKDNPDVSLAAIKDFCSCMAEGEADNTTEADIAYVEEHHKASDEYKDRLSKVASACKKKVGSR